METKFDLEPKLNPTLEKKNNTLPERFVYLDDIDRSILIDMKYYQHDNLVGRPIKGYVSPRCILTFEAANAVCWVQTQLKLNGLGLKVFDGYRPQRAVDDLIAWSEEHDLNSSSLAQKQDFYPNIDKSQLFDLKYLVAKSSHTRGSTVDLTLINLSDGQELDMGTAFDFMDELSHTLNPKITGKAMENRLLLKGLMVDAGFIPVQNEWWHFTLKNEPFPDTYFDFEVK